MLLYILYTCLFVHIIAEEGLLVKISNIIYFKLSQPWFLNAHQTNFEKKTMLISNQVITCKTMFLLIEPPKAMDVFRLMKPRSASWNMIARELGVELLYCQELENSKQFDYEDKLERILRRWLESESSAPTWETIIDVLRKLKFTDVVRDVQQFIGVPAGYFFTSIKK